MRCDKALKRLEKRREREREKALERERKEKGGERARETYLHANEHTA